VWYLDDKKEDGIQFAGVISDSLAYSGIGKDDRALVVGYATNSSAGTNCDFPGLQNCPGLVQPRSQQSLYAGPESP
jgi:hypothetical protein